MKVSEAEKCPAFKATHIMFCAVQRVWKIALAFPVQVVDEHCNCACQLVRSALGSPRKRDHATAGSHTNITTLVFLDLWLCGKHPCATLTVTWGECDVTCNSWVGACCWSYLNADMFLVHGNRSLSRLDRKDTTILDRENINDVIDSLTWLTSH